MPLVKRLLMVEVGVSSISAISVNFSEQRMCRRITSLCCSGSG